MSKPKTSTFRDLKTSVGARGQPSISTSSAFYRSIAGDLANMSSTKAEKPVPFITHSIDSVLDNHPTPGHTLQPGSHLKPSWIGPPRPVTPASETMKQYVTIEYSSPGLQPPVYIFTSLSEPQWDEVEMDHKEHDKGDHMFSKTFFVEEGEYQYKFRLGSGDWWATDEAKPMVDDGLGNKNNLLIVKPEEKSSTHSSTATKVAMANQPKDGSYVGDAGVPKPASQSKDFADPEHNEHAAPAPLMKHETFAPHQSAEAERDSPGEQDDPFVQYGSPGNARSLLKHETFDMRAENDLEVDAKDDDDSSASSSPDHDNDDDEDQHSSPLLRHETFKPSSVVQKHAPLLDHESFAMDFHHRGPEPPQTPSHNVLSHQHSSPPIPAEADPNDPTLIKFPSDRAGIFAHIHRTSSQLACDESFGHPEDAVSSRSQHSSPTSILTASPTLTRVSEAEEDNIMLEKIREAEEEEYEKEEAEGEEMDPLRAAAPLTPPMTPMEPEDAGFEPKVKEERIVIEVVDRHRSMLDVLLDSVGKGSTIAVAVGLIVLAAGLASMQYM